mgnify:CR=1 FL=1
MAGVQVEQGTRDDKLATLLSYLDEVENSVEPSAAPARAPTRSRQTTATEDPVQDLTAVFQAQQAELEDKTNTILHLRETLDAAKARVQHLEATTAAPKDMSATQRTEYEETIARHLAFIDT